MASNNKQNNRRDAQSLGILNDSTNLNVLTGCEEGHITGISNKCHQNRVSICMNIPTWLFFSARRTCASGSCPATSMRSKAKDPNKWFLLFSLDSTSLKMFLTKLSVWRTIAVCINMYQWYSMISLGCFLWIAHHSLYPDLALARSCHHLSLL